MWIRIIGRDETSSSNAGSSATCKSVTLWRLALRSPRRARGLDLGQCIDRVTSGVAPAVHLSDGVIFLTCLVAPDGRWVRPWERRTTSRGERTFGDSEPWLSRPCSRAIDLCALCAHWKSWPRSAPRTGPLHLDGLRRAVRTSEAPSIAKGASQRRAPRGRRPMSFPSKSRPPGGPSSRSYGVHRNVDRRSIRQFDLKPDAIGRSMDADDTTWHRIVEPPVHINRGSNL
jgi:hypothetical protein